MMRPTDEIGLAELRQNASEVVRRVEKGEELVITVSGRPAARVVGVGKRTWMSAGEVREILRDLPPWGVRDRDEDAIDDGFADPWDRADPERLA